MKICNVSKSGLLGIIIVLGSFIPTVRGEYRTWTPVQGQKYQAQLIWATQTNALLQIGSKKFWVDLSALSDSDKAFITQEAPHVILDWWKNQQVTAQKESDEAKSALDIIRATVDAFRNTPRATSADCVLPSGKKIIVNSLNAEILITEAKQRLARANQELDVAALELGKANTVIEEKARTEAMIAEAKRKADVKRIAEENARKAAQVANIALQPMIELIQQGRFWEARAEIGKASDEMTRRATDAEQLVLIQREIDSATRQLDGKIEAVFKEKANLLEIATRDATEAMNRLEALHSKHPDLPDYDMDKIKITDLRAKQISEKFSKKFAAIEEVIPNDPDEAKAMIKRLIESGLDPDTISNLKSRTSKITHDIVTQKFAKKIAAIEDVIPNDPHEAKEMIKRLLASGIDPDDASILKSRISKLNRDILDREVALITKDMDEAQSYLTKISSSIAREISQGQKPTFSDVLTTREGTENLVRARSLQAGAVKRLEVLLSEPEIENITKSKLVGLLEAQKAALAQMDGTLHESEAQASKMKWMIIIIGGAVSVLALTCGVFIMAMRRRGKSAGRACHSSSLQETDQGPVQNDRFASSDPVAVIQPPPVVQGQKACPFCGETILAVAKICRFCGEDLTPK